MEVAMVVAGIAGIIYGARRGIRAHWERPLDRPGIQNPEKAYNVLGLLAAGMIAFIWGRSSVG